MKKLEVKTSWSQRCWHRSTDRTLGLKAPDARSVRPIELSSLHSTEGIAPDAGLYPVKEDRTHPDANSCGWHIGARVKKLEVKTSWSRRRWRRSTDRTLGLKAPDAGWLRLVRLTYGDAVAGV